MSSRRLVDGEDERREHDFASVRIWVGDSSRRRPIRMGFGGWDVRGRQPAPLLSAARSLGKIQAQLLMAVDRDWFGGLDDLEGQAGSEAS